MVTNCGQGTCQANQGFYQDVFVSDLGGKTFEWGGMFTADGSGASANIALWEMRNNGSVIAGHNNVISPNGTFQRTSSSFVVDPRTERLRYQAYLYTPNTFWVDELFAQPASCQDMEYEWTAQQLYHLTGQVEGTGHAATPGTHNAGFLQYGPYTTNFDAGSHTASFRLQTNSTSNSQTLGYIDVNVVGSGVVAHRKIKPSDFAAPNVVQCFSLPFSLTQAQAGAQLEFRVYWYGTGYLKAYGARATPHANCEVPDISWTAQNLPYTVGTNLGSEERFVDPASHSAGYLNYGPYTTAIGEGHHNASWKLLTSGTGPSTENAVKLDVYDFDAGEVLASRIVTRGEFLATDQFQCFNLPFYKSGARDGHRIEMRAYWYDKAYVRQKSLGVF